MKSKQSLIRQITPSQSISAAPRLGGRKALFSRGDADARRKPIQQIEPLERRLLLSAASGLAYAPVELDNAPTTPATVVDGKAIFATTGRTIEFDVYNPAEGAWSASPAFPGRAPSGVATVGNEALFAGDDSPSIEIYNARHNRWTSAALPHLHSPTAATAVGNQVLFTGGTDTKHLPDNSAVDIYNIASGSWSAVALSHARYAITAASVGHYALFAGGSTGINSFGEQQMSDVVDVYDAWTGHWSTASLSQARFGMSVAVVDGKVIFAGGIEGTSMGSADIFSDAIDIFNSATGDWSTATLSAPAYDMAVAVVGDQAFFALSNTNILQPSAAVDIYNATSGVWSQSSLSLARSGITGTSLGDLAVFAGGYTRNTNGAHVPSNVVDIYTTTTEQWSTTTVAAPQQYVAALTAGPTAVFITGGNTVDTFTDSSLAPPILNGTIGLPSHGHVAIGLTNSGTGPLVAGSRVSVYASAGKALDAGSVLMGSLRLKAPLGAGSAIHLSLAIKAPRTLSAGPYYLIAAAGPRGNVVPFAVSRRAVNLAPAAAPGSSPSAAAVESAWLPRSLPGFAHAAVAQRIFANSPAALFSTTPIGVCLRETPRQPQ